LEFLHLQNWIHGDVRSDNIMVDPNSLKMKFIDFELSCRVNDGSSVQLQGCLGEYYNGHTIKDEIEALRVTLMKLWHASIFKSVVESLFVDPVTTSELLDSFHGIWVHILRHSKVQVFIYEAQNKPVDFFEINQANGMPVFSEAVARLLEVGAKVTDLQHYLVFQSERAGCSDTLCIFGCVDPANGPCVKIGENGSIAQVYGPFLVFSSNRSKVKRVQPLGDAGRSVMKKLGHLVLLPSMPNPFRRRLLNGVPYSKGERLSWCMDLVYPVDLAWGLMIALY